jgi:hypothetical protein
VLVPRNRLSDSMCNSVRKRANANWEAFSLFAALNIY